MKFKSKSFDGQTKFIISNIPNSSKMTAQNQPPAREPTPEAPPRATTPEQILREFQEAPVVDIQAVLREFPPLTPERMARMDAIRQLSIQSSGPRRVPLHTPPQAPMDTMNDDDLAPDDDLSDEEYAIFLNDLIRIPSMASVAVATYANGSRSITWTERTPSQAPTAPPAS